MAICIRLVPKRQFYSSPRIVNILTNSNDSNDIEMNKSLVEIKQRVYVFTTFLLIKNTLSAKQLNWKGKWFAFAIISEVNGKRIEWLQSTTSTDDRRVNTGRGKEAQSVDKEFHLKSDKIWQSSSRNSRFCSTSSANVHAFTYDECKVNKKAQTAPVLSSCIRVRQFIDITRCIQTGHFISFDCLFENEKIFSCVASTERSQSNRTSETRTKKKIENQQKQANK